MRLRKLTVPTVVALLLSTTTSSYASTPASHTVSPSTVSGKQVVVTWTGTLPGGANAGSDCTSSATDSLNDHHGIDLQIPAGFYPNHQLTAAFSITPDAPTADVILTVVRPDGTHSNADNGGVGAAEQVVANNPSRGRYDAIACVFAGGPTTYTARLVLTTDPPGATPGGFGSPGTTRPSYRNYASPPGLGDNAGEPSIGVDWTTDQGGNGGTVMYQSIPQTLRLSFDTKGDATWSDVTGPAEGILTLDPILDTDSPHGRTFVAQLAGTQSLFSYTDNTGASWVGPTQGGAPSGVDHQTVGHGPYPAGLSGLTFPDAVYYCSQYLQGAFCARSDTGGLTFNGPRPVYESSTSGCGGLHGHLRVAPDGTAYLPNKGCNGHQAVAVSTNGGDSWQVREVPISTSGASDPSVTADQQNRTYFGFVNGDGHPEIVTSTNRGQTFTTPIDVGAAFGIQNAAFPEVIAGSGGRTTFGFLGTTTPGNFQNAAFGKSPDGTSYTGGEWHLYLATTYDGGQTWTTVDATPKDPVQRGSICLGGVACSGNDRNLLDFNDITVDKYGRALFAYADGCTGTCVTSPKVADNTHTHKAVAVRQTSGTGLFAQYNLK